MNYLLLSVGRRCELINDIKKSLDDDSVIVATDISRYAPALYYADKSYIVPRINAPEYIETIIDICVKEKINAVTTLIDPEIAILAKNREKFAALNIEVLAPYFETAKKCFDKYLMYQHFIANGIRTIKTWGTLDEFKESYNTGEINFPVFIKPRTGSGSVGARKVETFDELVASVKKDSSLIIQEYMVGTDLDADVYVDTVSHKAVSAFSKKKIESRIGGANKTVSFKDKKLFDFICEIVSTLDFNGPIDMDFFHKDGEYYISEINPRFGGAYLHAYGSGVDFVKLIENNLRNIENTPDFGQYEEGIVMMMFDSVVIRRPGELV